MLSQLQGCLPSCCLRAALPAGCPSYEVRVPCKKWWSASELLRLAVCSALPLWPLLLQRCNAAVMLGMLVM